jgi:hypothetical protein
MQDAISVAFEAGAVWVFFFGPNSIAWPNRASGQWSHCGVFGGFAGDAIGDICGSDSCP